jgi:hypothetical protein
MRPSEHLAALLQAEEAGTEISYLFFWGHQPQPDGSIGPACLSSGGPPRPLAGRSAGSTSRPGQQHIRPLMS